MKEPRAHMDTPESELMAAKQVLLYNARLKASRENIKDKQQEYSFRVITIGREIGSLAIEVAQSLAESTGWHVFDSEIVHYIAENNHVRESIVQELDEKKQNLVQDYVERLLHMATGDKFFGEDEYHLALMRTMATLAAHGEVIFVGHGSEFVFSDPWCLRIRIRASFETRFRRLRERWQVSEAEVWKRMRKADHEIQDFVRLHFRKDRDDIASYDLVFNTDHLSSRNVADAVLAVLKGGRK